ncbi:MAG: Hpt domain-containing protein, partial [Halothiobacillaceae bacterium]
LRAARLAEDGPALHELLHTLAGTAGLVGLIGLADAARRLDETWRAAGRTPDDGALWGALWQQAEEEKR